MGNTHSMLAGEIISNILTYVDHPTLYHCALIDRHFYITTSPLLWRNVYVPQDQAIAFLYPLVNTNRFLGHLIQHLNLGDFEFTDELLLLLMTRTLSMISVILDNGAHITDRSMQYVPYYWPRLKTIQLTGSTMANLDVFNNVDHLELWNCSGLLPTTFAMDFALETLVIDVRDSIALDSSGLIHLRYLRVHGGLAPGSHGWPPNLTSIYLDECVDWMDQDVLPLLQSCPRLTNLTLQDGIFTDNLLAMIAMSLPNLEYLDVSYNDQLTAQGVRQFVNQVHALQRMTLTYCSMEMSEFTEAGIHCAGSVRTKTNTVVRLNHLDREALGRIRRTALQFLME